MLKVVVVGNGMVGHHYATTAATTAAATIVFHGVFKRFHFAFGPFDLIFW